MHLVIEWSLEILCSTTLHKCRKICSLKSTLLSSGPKLSPYDSPSREKIILFSNCRHRFLVFLLTLVFEQKIVRMSIVVVVVLVCVLSQYTTRPAEDYLYTKSAGEPRGLGTSHLSVLDQYGNAVAVTTTVNHSYGSKLVGPRTGMCQFFCFCSGEFYLLCLSRILTFV